MDLVSLQIQIITLCLSFTTLMYAKLIYFDCKIVNVKKNLSKDKCTQSLENKSTIEFDTFSNGEKEVKRGAKSNN